MTQFVSQAEFARLENIHRSLVNRWVKNGLIPLHDGKIHIEQARALRQAFESQEPHHQARKAQFEEAKKAETMPALEKLGSAIKLETYKLQKAKAETINLELDKAAGLLVERAEVEAVLADFGATLRGLLESLPDRLAASIARHRGDVNAIHAETESVATALLTEMNQLMERKMQNV